MLTTFYEAVLPRTGAGHYCLFLLDRKHHIWSGSTDSLADSTEARGHLQGVYFGTASFKEPTSRTQANVLALRSLRLDIDAGAKKHEKSPDTTYATQRDATAALVAFSQATRIVPSFIVSSGEGLHVYYALEDELAPEAWLPLATRLGELCDEHGLRADKAVTTDTARVLRPIGSLHPNGSRVSILKATGKVYANDEITELLGATVLPPARVFDMSVNADVAAPVGPPKSCAKIVEHCGAMAEVAASRGDVPEPFWRAMLGVVKFTVEGADAAHEMSSGHPDYDPAETERKLEGWTTGPTSCAEFGKHSQACGSCKYAGKIKSPVMLGFMTPPEVAELPPELQPLPPTPPAPTGDPWDGHLTAGFSVTRKPDGELTLVQSVEVDQLSETGEKVKMTVQVPVTHTIFWLLHWSEATSVDDTAQATACQWDPKEQRTRSFPMDQSLVANRSKLLEFLAGQAIICTTHKRAAQAMSEHIINQLHRIKMLSRRPKIADHFGMRILPDGKLVCAHGKHVLYPDGTIQEGMLSKPLREVEDLFPIDALPAGESGEWPADVWDDNIRPAARKYVAFMSKHYGHRGLGKYRLAIMLGMASPFMAFVNGSYHSGTKLPPNGLSVSLYSRQGGRGKTTLVQAIMLAFGNPGALVKDSGGNGATDIARIVKLSLWGTMPSSMEEMGNAKESSIAALISSVANGSGRERGTKTGGMTSAAQWALINFITTNRAQRDMVTATQTESSAIQYRLLELNVDNTEFDAETRKEHTEDWSEIQRECAGALGALLEYKACALGVEKVNKLVMDCVTKASAVLKANQDARFQYRALGALFFVHTLLASEGMVMFDLKDLVREFQDAHDSGVAYVAENVLPTDGVELMQMMLSDLKPSTLITESETHRGANPNKFDLPLNNRVPDVVLARHVTSLGHTYVSTLAVKDWCAKHKISERDLLADCKKAGAVFAPNPLLPNRITLSVDLFKGTKEADAAICRCYRVDTRKLREHTGVTWDGKPDAARGNVLPLVPKVKPQQEDPPQSLENGV